MSHYKIALTKRCFHNTSETLKFKSTAMTNANNTFGDSACVGILNMVSSESYQTF